LSNSLSRASSAEIVNCGLEAALQLADSQFDLTSRARAEDNRAWVVYLVINHHVNTPVVRVLARLGKSLVTACRAA
jgi:hypothetical protein